MVTTVESAWLPECSWAGSARHCLAGPEAPAQACPSPALPAQDGPGRLPGPAVAEEAMSSDSSERKAQASAIRGRQVSGAAGRCSAQPGRRGCGPGHVV